MSNTPLGRSALAEREALAARLLAGARRGTEPSAEDERRVRAQLHGKVLAAPLLLSAKSAHALSFIGKLTVAKIVVFVGVCGTAAVVTGVALRHAIESSSDAPTRRVLMPAAPQALAVAKPRPNAEVAPSAAAEATVPAFGVGAESAPPAPSAVAVPKHAAVVASSVSSAPRLSPQDMQAEIAGLRRAQQLLHSGNSAGAVAALDELGHQVPAGGLMEERDATRVIALCMLGRASDSSVDSFLARYPSSVHANRVRTACSRASFE